MTDAVIIHPKQQHKSSIIWLHGLGADGHDFEPIVPELGLNDELGIKFIFPHAPHMPVTINAGMTMRAWYDVKHPDLTQQEDEKSIIQSAKIIEDLLLSEITNGIPADHIILAGFSQGGAIALYQGLRFNQSLAGILALSTYLPLSSTTESEKNSANQSTAILQMHGQFDPVIPVTTARNSFEYMRQMGLNIEWKEYPMPHSLYPQQVTDIGQWIENRLSFISV